MSDFIKVKFDVARFESVINRVKFNFLNKKPVLFAIGATAERGISENFRNETDDIAMKWAPLAPLTLALRKKGKNPTNEKILQDTGRLRTTQTKLTQNSVIVGTTVDYGKIHQEGGLSPSIGKIIPQRKWLYLSTYGYNAYGRIKSIVNMFLQKAGAHLQ